MTSFRAIKMGTREKWAQGFRWRSRSRSNFCTHYFLILEKHLGEEENIFFGIFFGRWTKIFDDFRRFFVEFIKFSLEILWFS